MKAKQNVEKLKKTMFLDRIDLSDTAEQLHRINNEALNDEHISVRSFEEILYYIDKRKQELGID